MNRFRSFLQPSSAKFPGNQHIGAEGNPQEKINENPNDRCIVAHRGKGLRPNKTAQDHNICSIEHLLQDTNHCNRDCKLKNRSHKGSFQHIDLRSAHLNHPHSQKFLVCLSIIYLREIGATTILMILGLRKNRKTALSQLERTVVLIQSSMTATHSTSTRPPSGSFPISTQERAGNPSVK